MNINGKTKLIGLIGNPLEHTLSPFIHNKISQLLNQNVIYLPFLVENDLDLAIKGGFELQVLGFNITIPYKNQIIQSLVDIDSSASEIGAVNTLVRSKDKKGYKGYNTDFLGLKRQLFEDSISLKDKTVVVLGAGGASKAVVYLSCLEGASKIYILNRTFSNAEKLATKLSQVFSNKNDYKTIIPLSFNEYDKIVENHLVVFQATSVGMFPNISNLIIKEKMFYQKIEIGIDLIYNPANTKFMKMVEENGGKAYNTLKMLLYQGVISYELWNDIRVPKEVIDDVFLELKRNLYPKDNIILIGFMGSGKSSVGRELAIKNNMKFIDTDTYIEKMEGMSISDIFSKKGEKYFRNLERSILDKFNELSTNTVFATGGGMPLHSENASLLKELGTVFYLKASSKVIYERIRYSHHRPLLHCKEPYQKIYNLMNNRNSLYEKASDVMIDTNENNINETIKKINDYLKK